MEDIIRELTNSISDLILSKQEKQSLKTLISSRGLGTEQINFLRSKMYELANEKSNESNYKIVLEWVKNTNSLLSSKPLEKAQSSAYFSPGESCRQAINSHINSASVSLKICIFTISDDMIAQAILAAKKRNVAIQLLTDNDKLLDLGSDITQLSKEGIAVKVDNTSNHMHHKFMVIDEKTLLTGSYNWTRSAEKFNQENIIVTSEAGLVRSFCVEFERLWGTMEPYQYR
ncbi:phospholipase D-like domain-containing protein [soil metagenome]